MFYCLKRSIQAALCAACAAVFLLDCTHDYNPFDNYSNARAGLLPSGCSKNIRSGHTLDIFTTETLSVYTSVREKIESIQIQTARNRFWSDTSFSPPFKDSIVLLLSFWDTGTIPIYIMTYRSNRTSDTTPLSFQVRSPLTQKPISTVFGRPLTLSTVRLGDNDNIEYIWLFGQDTVQSVISNTYSNPYARLQHVEIGETETGYLYVSDLLGRFRSPSTIFTYLFRAPPPPGILCINKELSGHTIITGDSTFVFKFKIIDSSFQGLASVDVSGKRPQMLKGDTTYFENIDTMAQYSLTSPKKEIVTATNKLSQTTVDTFFVYFDSSGPHSNDIITFKLISPSSSISKTGQNIFDYSVNISNFSQAYALARSIVTSSMGKIDTLSTFTLSNVDVDTVCHWIVPLDTGFNTITTDVRIQLRGFITDTTIVIERTMNITDTTRPEIFAMYVNDVEYPLTWDSTKVLSVDSPNVIVKVYARDNESGIDSVTIVDTSGISPPTTMKKNGNNEWVSAPIAFGAAGSIMKLRITVKSNAQTQNNTATRTIKVSNVSAGSKAPIVAVQPKSQKIMAGQDVTFSTAATGTEPLKYQWYKDGGVIPGANSESFSLRSVQASDAGTYTVVVSNGTLPNATSSGAVLTVSALPVAPSITVQPQSQTITTGQNVTFSVTATGTEPLKYQWFKNGTAIFGATSAIYSLSNVQSANAGTYTVTVSNGALPNATSDGATLTVSTAPVAPSITAQPQPQTITAGQSAAFSVTATGTAPLLYQWYKNGTALSGATSSSYTLSNAQTSDAGTFTVTVSNGIIPNATSGNALLTVNPALVAPSITVQPQPQTITTGQNAAFSVTATGTAPLSYQWYKNGTALSGATSSSYTLSNAQTSDAGTFTVTVSNGTLPNATSSGAALTVNPALVAPSITVQPKSDTVTTGQNVTFSVTATGTAPLSYQWYKNGTAISGATSSSYALSNVKASDAGTYTVSVSNGTLPNATSSGAALTVTPALVAPSITSQPKSDTITAGQSETFKVTATGTAPLSYQWYKNGTAISGATSSSYSLSNVKASDAGTYTVTVSNGVSPNATSGKAVLTVKSASGAPVITVQPKSQTITQNQDATFSVTATGTGTLSYQWYKNGTAVSGSTSSSSGATSSSFSLYYTQAVSAGTYTVTVSNGSSSGVTSDNAVLTVVVWPTITTQPQPESVAVGQKATFTVSATGTPPFSYQWLKNGKAISGATSSSYTLSSVKLTDSAAYSVTVSNGTLPNAVSNDAVLTVNYAPSITGQPKSQTVASGKQVTMTVTATGSPLPTYQWYKDGKAISGEVWAGHTVWYAQSQDAGTYTVTVSNGILPNVTSNAATLKVTP